MAFGSLLKLNAANRLQLILVQAKTKRSVTVYPSLIISYFINLVKSVWSKSKMVSFNKLSEEKGFIEIGPILL